MNRKASVTMKLGSLVRITMAPLTAPSAAAHTAVSSSASTNGRCSTARLTPRISPASATIEPMERSNSPPIISSAAATARMPSSDAGAITVITPPSVNIDLSA
jgi:hypothetical protein